MRVLITGGAKELGRAFSDAVGARGHRLVITGRDERALAVAEQELRARGVEVEAHVADLADPQATPKLIESVGPIDVLVNNAALGGPVGPTWEVDENEWWRTFEVNLRGLALATTAALRTMTSGRIVNIVSNAGVHRWPLLSAYSVSKAAVLKLGENLAAELRDRPIAVLSYDPGMVDVGLMGRGSRAAPDDEAGRSVARWARSQREQGRFTPVEQSAGVLARIVDGEFDHRSGGLVTPAD
ncbi:SDR family NAD(P)-dependent oxidoreductase [Lentzea chajnantorensis]